MLLLIKDSFMLNSGSFKTMDVIMAAKISHSLENVIKSLTFLKFKSWIYLYKCIHNYERSKKNNVIKIDTINTNLFKK